VEAGLSAGGVSFRVGRRVRTRHWSSGGLGGVTPCPCPLGPSDPRHNSGTGLGGWSGS
jgi:hypothetical protein